MKVWKAFARSRRVRIVCFALAGALLVASTVGLVYPAAPAEEVPTAQYEHRGRFDYTVYIRPSILYGDLILTEEEEVEVIPMLFFRNIIRDVQLAFSYNFDSAQPLANVINQVVVSVIAENPGVWQKEMIQLEEVRGGREFRVDFPLDLSHLDRVFTDIENEIGIVGRERQLIIRAVVTTTAQTALGQTIKDTFSYELPAILTARELELTGNLESSEEGFREGTRFEARGRFDYEVSLHPNALFETEVLKSEALPVPQPPAPAQTLGPGLVYFPRLIDNIQASFYYRFLCDRPILEQSQVVEVTVVIENPGRWSRSLVWVPETSKVGNFAISFPIDIQFFTRVIDAIGEETGVRGASHRIVITANVHTIAHTDVGTIDEVFTQTLGATLDANTLVFGQELSLSQAGTIRGTPLPGASPEDLWRTLSIIGLMIAVLALGYLGWNQTRLGVTMLSAGAAEAVRAGKKYKQQIVDIEALPGVKPTETVIHLSSLDDLARISDDLVKPMLHQAEEGAHTYYVIDGSVRYLYIIKT